MNQNTLKKLREAQFFLNLLHKKAQTITGQDEEFDFLLSAFLSSGRSVTLVFQHEEKEKYDSLFNPWFEKLDKKGKEIFKLMNNQRVRVIHHEGFPDTEKNWEYDYLPIINFDTKGHPAYYGVHWFGPVGSEVNRFGHREHYFNLGDSKEEVLGVCKKYLSLLEQFLQDCVKNFPEVETK